MNKICDECETVAHCNKHGCVPKQQALDKMAENARELGLDYEPAGGTQVSKVWWDGEKLMAKPIPLEDIYQPAPVHEPSRTQTKQIVDGLQRCHHPDSQHEFLRTWIRDWTIHKTAQRQWVGLTDEEWLSLGCKSVEEVRISLAIQAKLKEKNT